MSIKDILRGTYLFKDFNDREIAEIESISALKTYAGSQRIFTEGDEAYNLYIIASGSVKIVKVESGEVVAQIEKGNIFGEMPFLDGAARSASAIALESVAKMELVEIPYAQLSKCLLNNPESALKFYMVFAKFLSKRLRVTTQNLEEARGELYRNF